MKDIALKSLFLIPAIFFVDYIVMIIIGCATCYFGAASGFYDCAFCNIGKFVLAASIILFIAVLIPDVRNLLKKKREN